MIPPASLTSQTAKSRPASRYAPLDPFGPGQRNQSSDPDRSFFSPTVLGQFRPRFPGTITCRGGTGANRDRAIQSRRSDQYSIGCGSRLPLWGQSVFFHGLCDLTLTLRRCLALASFRQPPFGKQVERSPPTHETVWVPNWLAELTPSELDATLPMNASISSDCEPGACKMLRSSLLSLGLAVALLATPVAGPINASAQSNVTINVGVGTNLNRGRGITCSQGARILRNRGFRDVRRIDCRGRFFVYRAWRGSSRFEIAVRQRDGRVVDVRRIGRR